MNNEKLGKLMERGLNCSQTVLLYFLDRYDLKEDVALKISQGFESGHFKGNLCGSVSGGIIVLSLEYGDGTKESRSLLKEKVNAFISKYNENSSIICEEILGINISSDENLEYAFKEGIIQNKCPEAIKYSIEILEEMLEIK